MQTFESRTGDNMSGSASQRLRGIDKSGFSASDLQSDADYGNRDSALRDAGDGDGARQDMQRGEASRSWLASNFGGGGFGGDRFGGRFSQIASDRMET